MNISYQWLRSIVPDLRDSHERLAERLAMYGAPVEEIVDLGGPLRDVVIARVKDVRRHPNADRLSVCAVDAGGAEMLQVVCGAPNVQADRFYPFAPVGATLPGDFRIGRRRIRGEESQGMLCSARELGLGRDHEGILELHGVFTTGERMIDALGLDDVRLALEVTPNRPDLLSHWGVAREVAPGGAGSLALPIIPGTASAVADVRFRAGERSVATDAVRIVIEDPADCPRYIGAVIRGVRIGPSPEWLATRLRAVGARPINNVVDATNFVLHELGQPLHAFDLDRVGGTVVVRRARERETLVTLDGVARALSPAMLVIADADRPIALAGLMGGEDAEVRAGTSALLLECALFSPAVVRDARRALGMSTDASYRFERGVDPDAMEVALRRAVAIILATAGGVMEGAALSAGPGVEPVPAIELGAARARQILGVPLLPDELAALLEPIGFATRATDDRLEVNVPGHRRYDVSRPEDLVEEVARRYGYDRFPDEPRPFRASSVPADPMDELEDRLRTLLVAHGFFEARSAAFAPQPEGDVALLLPLASTESHLRRALVPGLVHRLEANFNRGAHDVRLFEIGTVFASGAENGMPGESRQLAALFTGRRSPPHWSAVSELCDLWDLKGLASDIAASLGLTLLEPDGGAVPAPFDPAAAFLLNGGEVTAGHAGRVRDVDPPPWADAIWALEVRLDPAAACSAVMRFRPLPSHPAVERDLALLLPAAVSAATAIDAIRGAAGTLLENIEPFDVYAGPGIAHGRRSLAVRMRFRAPDRTLTDSEVDQAVDRVLHRLKDEHDVEHRG